MERAGAEGGCDVEFLADGDGFKGGRDGGNGSVSGHRVCLP